ncbi:MAG: PilZ domain-containing protein [Treponema sp.]|nr:PilZ domain-containing protein [Treponema sp.]
MSENVNLGKKVFFLHPSAVIQNRVIAELAQEEFEVYSIKDEVKLKDQLVKYPDSLVFACINEGLKSDGWEKWIRETMADQATANVGIGVITLSDNEADRQKYTEQLKVKCGYIVIKSNIAQFNRQMAIILNHCEAKGRRKFIRLSTEGDTNTTVNIPMSGTFLNGHIRDISVVGFSCNFTEDPELAKNKLFPAVQLRLHSQLLNVEAIAYGSRAEDDKKTYVMLFSQKVDSDERSKIRKFIHATLQARMDHELR